MNASMPGTSVMMQPSPRAKVRWICGHGTDVGWRQAGVKDLADFHSLRVCPVSDRLWNLAVQDPVSQAKHPQGNSCISSSAPLC